MAVCVLNELNVQWQLVVDSENTLGAPKNNLGKNIEILHFQVKNILTN